MYNVLCLVEQVQEWLKVTGEDGYTIHRLLGYPSLRQKMEKINLHTMMKTLYL